MKGDAYSDEHYRRHNQALLMAWVAFFVVCQIGVWLAQRYPVKLPRPKVRHQRNINTRGLRR